MEAVKQVLLNNSFTIGLLNRFIAIAGTENYKESKFFTNNLEKVKNIRKILLSKGIVVKELEEVFEKLELI